METLMPKRMLIDASHPEETRVVVLDGQKVEEFDFESATKKPLKGNIYLAKVTRVEPSLQAAFVEYGGNRQGFLAFSEIHPDYYQIPVADRMALLAEQEAEARRRAEEEFEIVETGTAVGQDSESEEEEAEEEESEGGEETSEESAGTEEAPAAEAQAEEQPREHAADDHEDIFDNKAGQHFEEHRDDDHDDQPEDHSGDADHHEDEIDAAPEMEAATGPELGNEQPEQPIDAAPQIPSEQQQPAQALQAPRASQRWTRRKHYKIQEVIKRRQIILVQVVKEERGNKGAALTTYLSLAGRYCVLMPNTPRGGGISRKITNAADRKRLKSAAATLELPEGMGLIIRTAGESRTKLEIKRDYEYLLRMWDTIRELTLKSNAPACVYEEGDLIKRAIRDLYNKDVADIVVEGDDGYRNAKDFMRMLMPSHAKNVKPYKESVPLFQRHHIEAQLDAMFQPTVTLKSGGYIVINQTEALVSIDVNSGRATREHNIEDTAYKTNMEAAEEIGRQLRLRDLAGLVVIDFIDMEDQRNDRNVEKRLRDCVKNDRARIQIGKISQFGLLEMSRQRLRAGVVAGSTVPCPHCMGQGIVRSVESTALRVLRALEEEGQKMRAAAVSVHVAQDVAIYTLNQKRRELARIENDYGMVISFDPKADLPAGHFDIERTQQKAPGEQPRLPAPVQVAPEIEEEEPEILEEEIEEEEEEETAETQAQPNEQQQQGEGGGRRRRRRRKRGGRDRGNGMGTMQENIPQTHGQLDYHGQENGNAEFGEPHHHEPHHDEPHHHEQQNDQQQQPQNDANGEGGRRRRRRRRGRRGRGGEQQQQFGNQPAQISGPRGGGAEIVTAPPTIAALPNAPSTPSWSLAAERAESQRAAAPPREEPKPQRPEPAPMRADEPAQPVKKGWWQKAFKRD
jgi:ribonuclease E